MRDEDENDTKKQQILQTSITCLTCLSLILAVVENQGRRDQEDRRQTRKVIPFDVGTRGEEPMFLR